MKLTVDRRIAETSGFESTTNQFSIKTSAKAFEVLSSNLYSDKVLAVIREYSTNALDAQIMVNKGDEPFEVHLPNNFEPFFAVRDFGPGMAYDEVTKLYTTYFHSTKDDSNDVTGCLGLGSKSAFAYTDQFTITSWFGGHKMTFNAFLSEDGTPQITCISDTESDEPNGIKIFIPVKSDDFQQFAKKAREVYFRFPVQPEITGNTINIDKVKYILSGPNYKVRFDAESSKPYYQRNTANHGVFAIQGPIAYPIETDKLSDMKLSPQAMSLLNYGMVDIAFPMGALGITASRERLDYNKATKANLAKALEEVVAHIPTHAKHIMDGVTTLYEAKLKYVEWAQSGSIVYTLMDNKLNWGHVILDGPYINFSLHDVVTVKDANGDIIYHKDSKGMPMLDKPTKMEQAYGGVLIYRHGNLKHKTVNPSEYVRSDIKVSKDNVIIYDDIDAKNIHKLIKYNYGQAALTNHNICVIVVRCSKARLGDAMRELGNPSNVINISTLNSIPKAPKKQTTKVSRPVIPMYKVTGFYSHGGFSEYKINKDNVPNDGIYFISHENNPVDPQSIGTKKKDGRVNYVYSRSYNILGNNTEIYRVNYTHKNSIIDNPNWTGLHTALIKRMKHFLSKVSNTGIHSKVSELCQLLNQNELSVLNLYSVCTQHDRMVYKQLGAKSKLKKFIDKIDSLLDTLCVVLGDDKETALVNREMYLSAAMARLNSIRESIIVAKDLGWIDCDTNIVNRFCIIKEGPTADITDLAEKYVRLDGFTYLVNNSSVRLAVLTGTDFVKIINAFDK